MCIRDRPDPSCDIPLEIKLPSTCSLETGLVVPIPTLPVPCGFKIISLLLTVSSSRLVALLFIKPVPVKSILLSVLISAATCSLLLGLLVPIPNRLLVLSQYKSLSPANVEAESKNAT